MVGMGQSCRFARKRNLDRRMTLGHMNEKFYVLYLHLRIVHDQSDYLDLNAISQKSTYLALCANNPTGLQVSFGVGVEQDHQRGTPTVVQS